MYPESRAALGPRGRAWGNSSPSCCSSKGFPLSHSFDPPCVLTTSSVSQPLSSTLIQNPASAPARTCFLQDPASPTFGSKGQSLTGVSHKPEHVSQLLSTQGRCSPSWWDGLWTEWPSRGSAMFRKRAL